MKKTGRIISLLLVIAMCISLFPTPAVAAKSTGMGDVSGKMGLASSEIVSGSCGDKVKFELNLDTAEMEISGTGEMDHWDSPDEVPWSAYWEDIQVITVLDGVTSISQYAFSEIGDIESLTLPESITTVEEEAFNWVRTVYYDGHLVNWLRMLGENTDWYSRVRCDTSAITEPSGSNVTYTLDFTSGVMTISGTGAMTQWESEEEVPWYPVRDRFDTVVIEDGVTSIGSRAFCDCNLQDVTIPASVTSAGEDAFSWVRTVRYGGNLLTWYTMFEDTNWYSELLCDGTTVSESCGADLTYTMDFTSGALTISGTGAMPRWRDETKVPWYRFRDKIHTVTLGEEVTSISRYAFAGCELESITIPVSVTTIAEGSFSWVHEVYYGGSTIAWYRMVEGYTGWYENLNSNDQTTEGSCGTNLTYTLDFSDGRLVISGTGAMARWMDETKVPWYEVRNQIRTVVLEDGVTSISQYAFRGCDLDSITIPASVTTISANSFGWADSVYYAGGTAAWYQMLGSYTGWYSELHSSGENAEGSCGDNLTYTLVFSTGMLTISGTGDMAQWTDDTKVPWYSFRDQIRTIVLEDGVTSISPYAFAGCYCDSITIPESVTTAANNAFSWIGTVNYGGSTFAWYQMVKDNTGWYSELHSSDQTAEGVCGENLRFAIDYEAHQLTITGTGSMQDWQSKEEVPWYYSRELIRDVIMEDGAASITKYAFYDCYFESITIPATVTEIEKEAFGEANKVYFSGKMIDWYRMLDGDVEWFNTFYSNYPVVTESFGDGMTWSFNSNTGVLTISGKGEMPNFEQQKDAPWDCVRHIIQFVDIKDGVTSIGSYAFANCDLRRLTAAASVAAFGENAFRDCWVETVNYAGRARTWWSLAHDSNCFGNVSCVDSVKNGQEGMCGDDAFYVFDMDTGILTITGTGAITEEPWWSEDQIHTIVIGSGITEISSYMFDYLENLTRVTIPNTVTKIGEGAFGYCSDDLVICGGLNSAAANHAIWNLITFEPFSDTGSSYEDYAIDMENSSLTSTVAENAVVSGSIPVTLNYKVRDDRFSSVFDKKLAIRFTENLEIWEDGVILDGKRIDNYEYDEYEHTLTVPVTSISDTLRFTLTPVEAGKVAVSAVMTYVYKGQAKSDAIGMLYLDAPLLKVTAPNQTSASEVTVNGLSSGGETIVFLVDGEPAGSVRARLDGSFSAKIRLADTPVSGRSYTITARLERDETVESSTSVLYEAGAPVLTKFVMYHYGDEPVDLLSASGTRLTNTFVPGNPFKFVLEFENPEALGSVYVSSMKNGVVKRMQAFPTGQPGEYIAEGYFDKTDPNYVPGVLNVSYNRYVSEDEATAEIQFDELSEFFRSGDYTIKEETESALSFDYTLEDGTTIGMQFTAMSVEDYLAAQGIESGDSSDAQLMSGGEAFAKLLAKMIFNYGEKVATNGVDTIVIHDEENASFRYIVFDGDSAGGAVYEEVVKYGTTKALEYLISETSGAVVPDGVVGPAVSTAFGIGKGYIKYQEHATDIQKARERIESSNMSEADKASALRDLKVLEWENNALGVVRVAQPILKTAVNLKVGAMVGAALGGPVGFVAGLAAGALFGIVTNSLINWAQKGIDDQVAQYDALGDGTYTRWIIDPSGYVYDVLTGEPLPGVTVTAYCILWDEEDPNFWSNKPADSEYGEVWDAEEYSQNNPLLTDAEGAYAWEVPQGWWRIQFSARGYETMWSDWMPVPPPQENVNMGMIAISQDYAVEYVSGTETSATVSLTNSTATDSSVSFMLAAFSDDGKMVAIETMNGDVAPSESVDLTVSYGDNVTSIKAFVMQQGTMTPLRELWVKDLAA